MKKILPVIFAFFLIFYAGFAFCAQKQLTFEWEQESDDLPENGGPLTHWILYSSTNPDLALEQWKPEGQVDYVSQQATYSANFTITVPDDVETNMWFRMKAYGATDEGAVESDFSEPAIPAPIAIDFKRPSAPVASGTYDNKTKIVTLTWTQDAADTDVVAHRVYKSLVSGTDWQDLGNQVSPFNYQVQASDSGKWMYFVVVAQDDDGNTSYSSNEVAIKLVMGVPFNLKVNVGTGTQ